MHGNEIESTRQLYSYNKKIAIEVYTNFKYTRHAVIETEKFFKDEKSMKSLDLYDTAFDLNLVDK